MTTEYECDPDAPADICEIVGCPNHPADDWRRGLALVAAPAPQACGDDGPECDSRCGCEGCSFAGELTEDLGTPTMCLVCGHCITPSAMSDVGAWTSDKPEDYEDNDR